MSGKSKIVSASSSESDAADRFIRAKTPAFESAFCFVTEKPRMPWQSGSGKVCLLFSVLPVQGGWLVHIRIIWLKSDPPSCILGAVFNFAGYPA